MPVHAPPADILPPPRAGRALALTLLVWSLLLVALVTLAPFEFRWPARIRPTWGFAPFELAVNCVLLLVPGALLRAAFPLRRDVVAVVPLLFGTAFSGAIELTQTAIPGRYLSVIDVATNAAGCWLGAMLFDAARRYLDRRLADRLLLELPLMGIVYLLVPLLWLAGEGSTDDARRLLLVVPLGLLGGAILASVWKHRLRPAGMLSPAGIGVVAAVWFSAAAAPALRHHVAWLAGCAAVVAVTTVVLASGATGPCTDGRRFEIPTLHRFGWLYFAYLAALAAWPLHGGRGDWAAGIGIPEIGAPPSIDALYRLVEHFAAFTLGGYMVAESLGRRDERGRRTCARVVLSFTTLAAALELVRAYAPDSGASVLRAGLGVVGASLGAVVYQRQVAAVRRWVEWRGSVTASERSCSPPLAQADACVPAPAPSTERIAADAATR